MCVCVGGGVVVVPATGCRVGNNVLKIKGLVLNAVLLSNAMEMLC